LAGSRTSRRRAAHFLLIPGLAHSPPNDAIIGALLDLDYAVDVYSPLPLADVAEYGDRVTAHPVEYGRRWLLTNCASRRWRQYDVFSATAEAPIAVAGVLSRLHRRPSFMLVDEIKSGSYYGDAREHWKRLCRWAMRHAAFCIVNDEARIGLLREYAGIGDPHRILVYPGCYRAPPPPADRDALRRQWSIPDGRIALGVSGGFNDTAGAAWLLDAFCADPALHLVVQAAGLSRFERELLSHVDGRERLHLEPGWLPWREAWAAAPAIDIGLSIYLNEAPQFQKMGVSSNRLCMFLAMGVPVIASRQPSFRFLEEYDCGVVVDDSKSFTAAVDRIAGRLPRMRENALRCAREYIRAPERYAALRERIGGLVR